MTRPNPRLRCPDSVNVLLLGTGGREHALAWRLKKSKRLGTLWVEADANAGLLEIGRVCPEPVSDVFRLTRWCEREQISLVVIGPEAPLAADYATKLADGPRRVVFGPSRAGAQLEWDKAFAKQVMRAASVPTADGRTFTDAEQALAYVATRVDGCVVKATGLCAGKGVMVCKDISEARRAVEDCLVKKVFGDAGTTILIEDRLEGPEVSVLALCDGQSFWILDPAQDHKRVGEGDTGPNTGGMGAFSPTPKATDDLLRVVQRDVLVPTVDALKRMDIPFRGVLYAGLMLTPAGPKVLEFNTRFGDPETQPIMARLKGDLVELCWATATGQLGEVDLTFDTRAACCVVVCSKGYPGSYPKGLEITGLDEAKAVERGPGEEIVIFHAGTTRKGGKLVTNGGRVLGVTALAETVERASALASEAASKIQFEGAFYRRDIGRSLARV
ncbi:MAG: phosphoribosylamine--glycine ligase [Planctomycetaceae bacterium]|nr:phosphoribosylamine--glycine ligase [Planctomycetaceae bacterium]